MPRLTRFAALSASWLASLALLACETPAPEPAPTPEDIAAGLLPAVQIAGEEPVTFTVEARLRHYNVPGVSVAVMDGGSVVWARGWGVADRESGRMVTPSTLFQAASISKPVAALVALSLVQEGRMSLDRPVNDYLTGWRVPESELTADSAVTLRGLLTHSAGLTVWGFPGYRKDRPFSEDQLIASNAQVLDGQGNTDEVRVYKVPGTSWQYSGGGYTVMEQLVEDVTGLPFHEAALSRVLEPAGMELSTYAQPLPEDRWSEAARGHRRDGSEVEGEWHTYPEQAAAGLWTTPSELLILSAHLLGILNGSVTDGVLPRSMVEAMLTPHHPGEDRYRHWGLGFGLSGQGAAATFGHGGSNEGFRAQWTVYGNRGQGVAVMTNGDGGADLAQEVIRAVSAAYEWPHFKPVLRVRRPMSVAELEAFTGQYALEGSPDLVITVRAGEDRLEIDVPGEGAFTVLPSADGEDEFFDADSGEVLRFERDEAGSVTAGVGPDGNRFRKR
jgi:CubicO group peptidase (beta-lactamase class C family)